MAISVLRPTDPDPLDTALTMARAGEDFAIELAGNGVPRERELVVAHGVGKMRASWADDGAFEGLVTNPRLSLATRARGRLATEDGRSVLRGRATNRTHWLWRAILWPLEVLFALLAVVAAVDGVWWLAASLALVALCFLGLSARLATRRSSAQTRALDLFALAGVLWAAAEAPEGAETTRPITEADRELLRRAAAVVMACDTGDWDRLLREWEHEDGLADGSHDAPELEVKPAAFALFLKETAAQDTVEPETLDLARQLLSRL